MVCSRRPSSYGPSCADRDGRLSFVGSGLRRRTRSALPCSGRESVVFNGRVTNSRTSSCVLHSGHWVIADNNGFQKEWAGGEASRTARKTSTVRIDGGEVEGKSKQCGAPARSSHNTKSRVRRVHTKLREIHASIPPTHSIDNATNRHQMNVNESLTRDLAYLHRGVDVCHEGAWVHGLVPEVPKVYIQSAHRAIFS